MKFFSNGIFSLRRVVVATTVFMAVFVGVQRILRYTCSNLIAFDCPYYWPVSIFMFRVPSIRDVIVFAAVAVVFYAATRFLESRKFDIRIVVVAGALLIAGTTFTLGVDAGFYAPVAHDAQTGTFVPVSPNGQEYYHDSFRVTDALDFLRNYNAIQPTLHRHSHTHPPGAVLTFYVLRNVLVDPALIGLAVMLIAVLLNSFFFYRILLTEFDSETSAYSCFLLLLLPAVQVYYLATVDAIVAGLLTGVVYFFCFGKSRFSVVGAAALTAAAFFLTFVSLFILPVLVLFDLTVRRSLRRTAIVVGSLVIFYGVMYVLTGYNAYEAFRTASQFENPDGPMFVVDKVNYLFTRLEDVAEILFFFGPFLAILFFRGFKRFRERPLNVLAAIGCASLLAMFVSGAFRTGETARACLFVFPYLLFPVTYYLTEIGMDAKKRFQLATLVFAQAAAMQLFGLFYW